MKLHRYGSPLLVLIGRIHYGYPPTKRELKYVQQQLEYLHSIGAITLEPFDLDSNRPVTITPEDQREWDTTTPKHG